MLEKQTLGPSNRNKIVAENIFQRSFKIYQLNSQIKMASSETQKWVEEGSQEIKQLWENYIQKECW